MNKIDLQNEIVESVGAPVAVVTTVVISDVHLASPVCRANALRRLLADGDYQRLIILGDLFDNSNFRRLEKSHWNLLGMLRKLSSSKRGVEIIWLEGNHDRHVIRVVANMIGARVIRQHEHYMLNIGSKKILFMHGHQFDDFINAWPVLTAVATALYNIVQRCGGRGRQVSRWLKYKSKAWIKASEKNQRRAINYGRHHGASMIVCGHTHLGLRSDANGIQYVNTGSWVDTPGHYALVTEQGLELKADWSED